MVAMDPQQFPGQPNLPEPGSQPLPPNQPTQTSQPQPDNQPRVHNPLAVMQPGEQIICEIRRHPIGMLGAYVMSGFILIVLAVLAFIVVPSMAGPDNHSKALTAGSLLFIVIATLVLIFVFIANKVYWGNHWVVTSDSITQITQVSLFNKQSSQLSLGNLEDVTAQQRGILQEMFKFGTIRAETAGERSKFSFPFCPNPNYYAQKILAAREVFEQGHHGGKQDPYQTSSSPQIPTLQPAAPTPTPAPQQFETTPQYQVGQTPPIFGDQPPSPPAEPTPQAPSQNPFHPTSDTIPGTYPDKPVEGYRTNIPE
jgi:hypothetical protein